MRILVDTERCILAGECVYNHPALFRFGPEGPPEALEPGDGVDPATWLLEARQAAEVCPSGAITVET